MVNKKGACCAKCSKKSKPKKPKSKPKLRYR